MSEDHEQGLICAYLTDSAGISRAVGWPEISAWEPQQGFLWVHLDFTQTHSARWLTAESGLDENIVTALLAEDGRPRSLQYEQGWLIMLRGVNTNPGAEPEDMVAIRLWLEPHRVISTRRRRLQSVQAVRNEIESGRAPTRSGAFLLQLLDGLVGRIADAVDGLESEIDAAEGDTAASYEQQSRLSELRRRCAGMRRHLSPQRDALDRVAREGGFGITEADGWMIREAGDQMVRALEDLDLARERTMVAHEQLQARLAQEQNSRIYLLSIVAAIFLPLSYLTGIFGMNVAGLPGVENPLGFAMVSGLMLILAIGLLVVFRFKRWL